MDLKVLAENKINIEWETIDLLLSQVPEGLLRLISILIPQFKYARD